MRTLFTSAGVLTVHSHVKQMPTIKNGEVVVVPVGESLFVDAEGFVLGRVQYDPNAQFAQFEAERDVAAHIQSTYSVSVPVQA